MANVLRARYLGGGLSSNRLRKVTVFQRFDNHVLALLDYELIDRAEYVMPTEDTPVTVEWGSSPLGTRVLYGYVNHYETKSESAGTPFTRVVVVGTSKPMNNTTPTSWSSTSRSAIARDIARRHKLRSIIHVHPFEVETWVSGNRSDFKVLQDLADEAGYHVWVDGSTLFFLDPTKVLTTAASAGAVRFSNADVRRFEPKGGSNVPGVNEASRRGLLFGLDEGTGEVFESRSGDPRRPTELITTRVASYAAAREVEQATLRKQQGYYSAEIEAEGNAQVYPGVLVQLDSARIVRDQQGFWLATEVEHVVEASDFTSTITLERGEILFPQRSTVRGAAPFTEAVVRDGSHWESALQEHVNVL